MLNLALLFLNTIDAVYDLYRILLIFKFMMVGVLRLLTTCYENFKHLAVKAVDL